MLTLFKL